jgi:uncharacterized protein (DUF1015 family)
MEVKPFKAFRFDEEVVGDVGKCTAPPYDVISPDQQARLYQKSEYNIIRITKGKTTDSDNASNNQYTRAADYLNSWIKTGVLKQDATDTIYGYVQDFVLSGTQRQRFSFIALARLEEFGKTVRPHEETFEEAKIDRLNLKRATAAKLGLVFMLYEDPQEVAEKIIERAARQEPLIDFVDDRDARHRLFAITDEAQTNAFSEVMSDKSCIIADGHHRYETGLSYYKETANPAAAWQMMAFVNSRQKGLIVLATHRLVGNLENFNARKLVDGLEQSFEISKFPFDSPPGKADARQKLFAKMRTEHDSDRNAFGIYTGDNAFYAAVLKDKNAMDTAAPNMSSLWKSLDVCVLHKLILERLLGVGERKLTSGNNVEYVEDIDNAVDESIVRVDEGEKQAAFFMNPVKMQQLRMVTDAGEKMPRKSTYFYPKIHTGLTINKL